MIEVFFLESNWNADSAKRHIMMPSRNFNPFLLLGFVDRGLYSGVNLTKTSFTVIVNKLGSSYHAKILLISPSLTKLTKLNFKWGFIFRCSIFFAKFLQLCKRELTNNIPQLSLRHTSQWTRTKCFEIFFFNLNLKSIWEKTSVWRFLTRI